MNTVINGLVIESNNKLKATGVDSMVQDFTLIYFFFKTTMHFELNKLFSAIFFLLI